MKLQCPSKDMSKEMIFIQGVAWGLELSHTMKAIHFVKERLNGKKRNDGRDAVSHSIEVCRYLMNWHIKDDVTLAVALLHDMLEDYLVTRAELEEMFGQEIEDMVEKCSKNGKSTEEYYRVLSEDIRLILVKTADRTCNISSMVNCFSVERMERYIEETIVHVLPMMKLARNYYLMYSDMLISTRDIINWHINVVLHLVDALKENILLESKLQAQSK
jgi:(p)ppGpp synthase/HD superfamily hydrolase